MTFWHTRTHTHCPRTTCHGSGRRVLDMLEEVGGEHAAQMLQLLHEAEQAGRFFNGPLRNKLGHTLLEAAAASAHREFKRFRWLLGRYQVDPGPPAHCSKGCVVVFASDKRDGGTPVALKVSDRWVVRRALLVAICGRRRLSQWARYKCRATSLDRCACGRVR